LRTLLEALSLFALDLLNALLGYWHIFGHDSTSFSNGLTDDSYDLEMSLIGFLFALDPFALKLLTGLACAKGIGDQLVTPHPIRDVFPFLQALPCVNLILRNCIESLVAMILKRSEIGRCDHAGLVGGSSQALILDGKFSASIEALLLFWKQLNCLGLAGSQFLPTRLFSEILLPHRHDRHFGVTVHHH
jgi:hypothetical protein